MWSVDEAIAPKYPGGRPGLMKPAQALAAIV